MTIGKNIIQYEGKEYVSATEFAKRFGITLQSVMNSVRNKTIECIHINGNRASYFDWETQKINYMRYLKVKGKSGRKHISTIDKATVLSMPKAPEIKEDNEAVPTIAEANIPNMPKSIINISALNPNDYPDCWLKDPMTGDPLYNSVTNNPELDYDKLKQRLTAEKYQLDIDQKRGKFIERDELTRSIISISNIINAGLAAIPQRYGAILIAEAERMSGYEFSSDERAIIRNVLKNEAANIMNSIRTEIENMTEVPDTEKSEEEQ